MNRSWSTEGRAEKDENIFNIMLSWASASLSAELSHCWALCCSCNTASAGTMLPTSCTRLCTSLHHTVHHTVHQTLHLTVHLTAPRCTGWHLSTCSPKEEGGGRGGEGVKTELLRSTASFSLVEVNQTCFFLLNQACHRLVTREEKFQRMIISSCLNPLLARVFPFHFDLLGTKSSSAE